MSLKKITLIPFTLLLLLSVSSFAQSTTFQFDKMNVAFKGLPNQITISTPNEQGNTNIPKVSTEFGSFEFVDFTTNDMNIQYHFNGEFEKVGRHTILVESEEDTLLVYQMRCKNIPDPQFMLDLKYKAGTIELDKVKKAIGIGPVLYTFDFNYRFKIKSYHCTIIKDGQIDAHYNCNSSKFSEVLKTSMQSLKSGDIILFDEIVVVEENGDERTIQSVNYRIK